MLLPYALPMQCNLNFLNRPKNLAAVPFLKIQKMESFWSLILQTLTDFGIVSSSWKYIYRHGASNAVYRVKIGPVVFKIDGGRGRILPSPYLDVYLVARAE